LNLRRITGTKSGRTKPTDEGLTGVDSGMRASRATPMTMNTGVVNTMKGANTSLSLTVGALLALMPSAALAQGQQINVTVDGEPVQFAGQPPIERLGSVLVPLRGVFERLGAQVAYDAGTRTILAIRGSTSVSLPLGSRNVVVNGQRQMLSQPAQVINGTTLVPLRFVSEALGANVEWRGSSQTVVINTNGAINGNIATGGGTVTSGGAGEALIQDVTFSPRNRALRPGDVLTVKMVALPNGRARFSLGDVVENRPLREGPDGVYTAAYTVKNGDSLSQTPLTVTFTSANGRTTTQTTDRLVRIGAVGAARKPVILSPVVNERVGNIATFTGRAAPNATLRYRLVYQGIRGDDRPSNGTIANGEVEANANGRWRIPGINLSTPSDVHQAVYTLEVTAVGAAGGASEAATVKFRQ
jgi:hypothetical protein